MVCSTSPPPPPPPCFMPLWYRIIKVRWGGGGGGGGGQRIPSGQSVVGNCLQDPPCPLCLHGPRAPYASMAPVLPMPLSTERSVEHRGAGQNKHHEREALMYSELVKNSLNASGVLGIPDQSKLLRDLCNDI